MTQSDDHGARILAFVERYQRQHHRSPTFREIGAAVGLVSNDHVARDLKRLVRQGLIAYKPRVSRSIVLLKSSSPRARTGTLPLPYLNRSDAPPPRDDLERLAAELFQDENDTFILRARGQAMRDAMLGNGDLVVVKRTEKFEDGDMLALYVIRERRTILKHVYRENGRLRVLSATPGAQPEHFKLSEIEVRGTVLAIIRKREM